MAAPSRTTSRKPAAKGSGNKRSTKKPSSTAKKSTAKSRVDTRVVNADMRRDIGGYCLIFFGVALFVGALLPSTGVITTWIASSLHLAFGVGAYILPVVMVIVGICLLIRFEEFRMPARVTLGAGLIFLAVLVILGLSTPGADSGDLSHFFDQAELIKRGGYLGAGIAWVLAELLGQVISIILMAGVIVVGMTIIGFSISSLVERIRTKHRQTSERIRATSTALRDNYRSSRIERKQAKEQALDSRRYSAQSPAYLPASSSAKTQVLDSHRAGSSASDRYSQGYAFADTSTAVQPQYYAGSSQDTISAGYGSSTPTVPAASSYAPEPASVAAESAEAPGTQTLTRRLGRAQAQRDNAPARPERTVKPSPAKTTSQIAPSGAQAGKTPGAAPAEEGTYTLPSMSLLAVSKRGKHNGAEAQAAQTAQLLQNTFADFKVYLDVVGWVCGPTVTLYKLAIPPGLKVQTINNLSADISRALMVDGVRIYSPVPGTPYVGIEVPNKTRETVYLADVLKDAPDGPLQVAIGQNVDGKSIVANLAEMPHILIGGTTGSGKSIAIHGMIMSILMRATPDEVRFIMIDPKRVEFSHYEGIPHLYIPPVTETKEASNALSWAVAEMELRLKKLQKAGARDILAYNRMVDEGTIPVENASRMPYIVIVIDELADLMMNVGKEVEFSISRLAQLARAAGIHLIVATQRPDSNIVTGLIKANITYRIALKVSSGINSSVIIDQRGAENLIGRGDMLFQTTGSPKPVRIQGCYVSDKEIDAVVAEWKKQGEPDYNEAILTSNRVTIGDQKTEGFGGSDLDPLLWEAADLVVSNNFASTSTIQRKLSVGYARAGRIMDQLEDKGIVGPPNGSKPREVLVDVEGLEAIKAFDALDADES